MIKDRGLVSEVFTDEALAVLKGDMAIGHNRYSTAGNDSVLDAQPLIAKYKLGEMAIVHNGNLINKDEVREDLINQGSIFRTGMDTENLTHLIARSKKDTLQERIVEALQPVKGAYCFIFQSRTKQFIVRDKYGVRPLSIGKLKSGGYIVASETCSFDLLDAEFIRDVKPGEMVILTKDGIESVQLFEPDFRPCAFEYVYFARPDSIIDGKLVYRVRERIGEQLSIEHPVDADMVSPVPDSGITSAIGYSRKSNINYEESLMKNRYIGRTFILPGQAMRETAVRLKMNTINENIKDKRIVLIDDSIVRGTTSRRIIDMMRRGGASEIHARVGSPPIIAPCYLGIDMASRDELIAANKTVSGVEAVINADSLGYLSIDGLVGAIGLDRDDLCLGCLTGAYPVEIPGEQLCNRRQLKLNEFK